MITLHTSMRKPSTPRSHLNGRGWWSNSAGTSSFHQFEVGLLGQVVVQVVLTRARISVQAGPPKLETQLFGGPAVGLGIGPHIPVTMAGSARGPGVNEPRVLLAGVVGNQIHQHPESSGPGFGNEPIEVVLSSQLGVDRQVVGHVVAPVRVGRDCDRTQPDPIDAQPSEIVEMVDDPGQIAHTVAVGVGEGTGIDLVEDPGFPPRLRFHQPVGNGVNGWTLTQQVNWGT